MSFSRDLTQGQAWIVQLMKSLGYKSDSGGICFGLAHMAMQAILVNDLDTFDRRLQVIHGIVMTAKSDLEALLREQNQIEADQMLDLKQLTQDQEKTLHTLIKTSVQSLSKDEYSSIIPFCEGIEFYHQADLYPAWFEKGQAPSQQNASPAVPLLRSLAFDKMQKSIEHLPAFSGIYTKQELFNYFHILSKSLQSVTLKHPIALVLDANHTVTLGYDPQNRSWTFTNANHLPSIRCTNIEALTNCIFTAYFEMNPDNREYISQLDTMDLTDLATVFSTKIYMVDEDKPAINQCIENCKKDNTWIAMHKISSKRADMTDATNLSLLHIAVKEHDLETINALIKKGADVNAADHDGETPLHLAVISNHPDIVKLLLDEGANPDASMTDGTSPLTFAIEYDSFEIANILLTNTKKPADPNLYDNDINRVPLLSFAIQKGNINTTQALLNACACPSEPDSEGAIPFTYAAQKESADFIKLLLAEENSLEHINHEDHYGATPLYYAVVNNRVDNVNVLLAAGADPNIPLTDNTTPLLVAVSHGRIDIVLSLLEAGADPTIANDKNVTPIKLAIRKGFKEIAQLITSATEVARAEDFHTSSDKDSKETYFASLNDLSLFAKNPTSLIVNTDVNTEKEKLPQQKPK